MLDRFLKQNSWVYNFEAGLEYDIDGFVISLSLNHMASWDDFEYYDFDSLSNVTSDPAEKSFVSQDEFRSELVEFHKSAPRYRGPLSLIGVRFGLAFRLPV
jgi:hypothetical protein